MQIGGSFYDVRRYDIVLRTPNGNLGGSITATADGALVRLSIPAQALDVVRDDVASSTSRTQIYTNPGDEAATIPALGFNLGATLTRPKDGPPRLPVAILLAGSGIGDRDGTAFGVPTLAQLAGRIADAGIMAVRFDKRGYGQSGGRAESATLTDYAEDVRAVVRWLSKRKDVDTRRIAVVGHSEGAWVGMLAASREGKIAALVTLAGGGSTGADLILEQQQAALDQAALAPADREARVALQKQIHDAVVTGKGWEGVPPAMRKQADTPWFQSVLTFDPAKVIRNVKQPILLVHGALDRQVPVPHAERLAELARKASKSKSVELVVVKGVNHLLAPAVTGEVSEYAALTDRSVSADVSSTVTNWLAKTFAAIK
jgi:pimeloyl-ACP methyl ester carboxylesterase